mgnify:CR=1 FL=1
MNIAQEMLDDKDMKQMVLESLEEKKRELATLFEEYKKVEKFEIDNLTYFNEDTIKKICKRSELEAQIVTLERDIRHIDFALKIHSGVHKEGEYEVLFEKAKQLSMKHVYELVTGEQVKRSNVRCVFHNERTPSMKIYEDSFHCFGCGAHGDMIDFVQRKNNCSHKEALEFLSKL